MSIIDWSDPEEMLGLLAEYLRDEVSEEHHDQRRRAFLRSLRSALEELASEEETSVRRMLARLRSIADAQPTAFLGDPALIHVHDCIQELERIAGQATSR